MQNSLSTSIKKIGVNSRVNVSSLIRNMKLDKIDVNSLVKNMSDYNTTTNYSTDGVSVGSILDKEVVIDLFRDSFARIRELFRRANNCGLVINSMIQVFDSEVNKLQNDIDNLQLFIDNYEFLSGKDDYYNFNYIEKFDNTQNSLFYEDNIFTIPDRDGKSFPKDGSGFVDTVTGLFKIGNNSKKKNVLTNISSINITTNYDNYITSDSKFVNAVSDSIGESWNVTVKSPSLINNDLISYNKYYDFSNNVTPGAQAVIDIVFNSAVEIDTIRLKPNFGDSFRLLQAVVFTTNIASSESLATNQDDPYILCLSSPRMLDSTLDVNFPRSLTNRVMLILNQQSYVRSNPVASRSENYSKSVRDFVDRRMSERANSFSEIQDIAFFFFRKRNNIRSLKGRDAGEYDYYSYRFPQDPKSYVNLIKDEIVMVNNSDLQDRPFFQESPIFADLVLSMSSYFDQSSIFIDDNISISFDGSTGTMSSLISNGGRFGIESVRDQFYEAPVKSVTVESAAAALAALEDVDSYEYSFGISSVDFLLNETDESVKASFVSSRIKTPGQIVALKGIVNEHPNIVSGTSIGYDLDRLYSYELSFSNRSNPVAESDWIPVMSFDKNSVDSEVLFFDARSLGAKLRFKAIPASITVYKNGMIVGNNIYSYVYDSGYLYLNNSSDLDLSAIWCVSYDLDLSNHNPFEVDFYKNSSFIPSSKRYRSINGQGERFEKTNSSGSVTLSYIPYINKYYSDNYSSYNNISGTVFTGPASGYSVVKITMDDGSTAINMTNYTNKVVDVTMPNSSAPYFVQSGSKIIFNQTISQGFYVDYEYSPNDTRFRIIVRNNTHSKVSGGIDSVLVKAKLFSSNPYYDKIRTINKV